MVSKRAVVVVLGDIGRSPRMQYHARSLLSHRYHVDIIAYTENDCIEGLDESNSLLTFHPLIPMKSQSVLMLPFKAIYLFFQLFWALCTVAAPSFVIVQNPPAIPSLMVCVLVCKLRGIPLVIDWHNFGCTILALKVSNRFILSAARWYERVFGGQAALHLCVSNSMRSELARNWAIPEALVVHDQPAPIFARASARQRDDLLNRLCESFPLSPLLEQPPGAALVVSATSWTADEKFDILFDALPVLDRLLTSKVIFILTGKGGARARYENQLSELNFENIVVVITYLDSFKDYATLLGSADLGISLHASSSGFDLPMKVVDMFGCELPVCAVRYPCISELVLDNVNGLLFDTASELAQHIVRLFARFPRENHDDLVRMRKYLADNKGDWNQNWNSVLLPALAKF